MLLVLLPRMLLMINFDPFGTRELNSIEVESVFRLFDVSVPSCIMKKDIRPVSPATSERSYVYSYCNESWASKVSGPQKLSWTNVEVATTTTNVSGTLHLDWVPQIIGIMFNRFRIRLDAEQLREQPSQGPVL